MCGTVEISVPAEASSGILLGSADDILIFVVNERMKYSH